MVMASDAGRRAPRPVPWGAALVATYALAALPVYAAWLGLDLHLRVVKAGITQRVPLPDLIAGTGERPFVLRALVPALVRGVDAAVPVAWRARFDRAALRAGGTTLRHRMAGLAWERDSFFDYVVASVATYAFLVGFAIALRALYLRLYPSRWWAAGVLPLFALATMPLFFQQGAHFYYDFATLLLFTVALLAIAERRWRLFYVAFLFAAINKETAILLTAVFLLEQWRERPRLVLLAHAAAQLTLWAVVRGLIAEEYRGNPGTLFEYNPWTNVALMRNGVSLPHVAFFAALLLAAVVDLRRESKLVRSAFLTILPLTAAYFVVGKVGEIRALFEVLPVGVIVVFNSAVVVFSDAATVLRRPASRSPAGSP